MSATTHDSASPVVHVYGDIEEEDNRLPNWWLAVLFGSMVFAFGYWFVFHVAHAAPSPVEVYKVEMAAQLAARIKANPTSNEALAALAADASAVAEGQKIFSTTCVVCHAPAGQGLVGPNLTDKFWLHGGAPMAIHKSVTDGYPEKGMQAWGKTLGPARVRNVVAFVLSIKGKNLPGKPPQGLPEP